MMPGTIPPKNISDTETLLAHMTMMVDGGMMGPMIAEAAVTEAA